MFVICSDLVGPDWDQQIRRWLRRIQNPIPIYDELKYTCSGRCGVDQRDIPTRMHNGYVPFICFCDKLCDEFGDCCFDFNAL